MEIFGMGWDAIDELWAGVGAVEMSDGGVE